VQLTKKIWTEGYYEDLCSIITGECHEEWRSCYEYKQQYNNYYIVESINLHLNGSAYIDSVTTSHQLYKETFSRWTTYIYPFSDCGSGCGCELPTIDQQLYYNDDNSYKINIIMPYELNNEEITENNNAVLKSEKLIDKMDNFVSSNRSALYTTLKVGLIMGATWCTLPFLILFIVLCVCACVCMCVSMYVSIRMCMCTYHHIYMFFSTCNTNNNVVSGTRNNNVEDSSDSEEVEEEGVEDIGDSEEVEEVEEEVEEVEEEVEEVKDKIKEIEDIEVIYDVLSSYRNEIVNDKTCCICFAKPSIVLFMPCRHLKCCEECSNKIKKCPLCRINIKNRIVAYT